MTEIIPISLGYDTCYVLRSSGVVVDAGQPNKGKVFLKGLHRASIRPDEVGLILLTHAHGDHMGSAVDIKRLTKASLVVHENEKEWMVNGNPPLPPGATTWGRIFIALHRVVMPLITVPPAPVDRTLGDEPFALEDFGVPGVVVHTPGHSPGSVSVLLESGEAFVGDLAMNRLPLRLTPGPPILADDPAEVVGSWRVLLELGARTVYPAHGRPFSADVIREVVDA